MLSIAVGIFAGIAVLALYKGMMKSRVRTVIYAEIAHIQVHSPHFKDDYQPGMVIKHGADVLRTIRHIPGVKYAVQRSITQGMLSTATGSSGVQINGIIPDQENRVSQLNRKLIEGAGFDKKKVNEVLVGKKLMDKMKIKKGSKLVLTFTDTSAAIVSGAFRVAGIYRSDNAPLDERNVFVELQDVNKLLGAGSGFHEIAVLLDDDDKVDTVKSQLEKRYPELLVESWKEISPETDLMVKTVNQYSYIIMVIIMIALAFGIINTMLMAILERTREIGMMLALGTTQMKIFLLILLETLFLTIAGTPFGILSAYVVITYYNRTGLDLSGMGKELMSSFGFETTIYPEFPTDKINGVLLIVIFTAIIACLIPAIKALKLQPVEALRR